MDEIQKAKGKSGAWLFQCCREPLHTKELDARWMLFSRLPTVAVADADDGNVGNIEEGQVHGGGREGTVFANTMPELIRGTEVE